MFQISIQSSIVQEICFSSLNEYSTKLFVKRDDLIHEFVSGNKWRKLKYAIEHCHSFNFKGVVTFGGAYSNHILACAAACHLYNLKAIAYIRGDELTSSSNALLAKCKELGMELLFIPRDAYDAMKRDNSTVEIDGLRYLSIPEGGANRFGIMGCMEILPDTDNNFDVVALAQGTTTTSLGVLFSTPPETNVFVFPVLKGFQSMAEMQQISESADCLIEWKNHQHKVQVFDDFHFGGYAKTTPELLSFISDFEHQTGIPLDPTYTGKALFGLIKTIEDKKLMNKRILFIHTGGVHKLLK